MQKPNNFDNTSDGSFEPINVGGHYLTIKKLEETQSAKGAPMIKVAIDFVEPDAQAGYFAKSFQDDVRPEKKWPFAGTLYIMTEDKDGKCSRNFKRFITAVEKSNNGFVTKWGNDFADQFKGKRLGGVYGIVEDEYNGEIRKKRQCRWTCEWDAVANAKVPDEKLLKASGSASSSSSSSSSSNNFMDIPAGSDDEVPF